MVLSDIDDVSELEEEIFSNPWSHNSIKQTLLNKNVCYAYIAEVDRKIVGYTIVWIIEDELHIGNLAVKPEMRRKKIGESLIKKVLEQGVGSECTYAYLEVRESNQSAISLYEKFGFLRNGVRKKYYPDNEENALIMFKFFKKAQ